MMVNYSETLNVSNAQLFYEDNHEQNYIALAGRNILDQICNCSHLNVLKEYSLGEACVAAGLATHACGRSLD
jgi:hypothetical protein